MPRETLASSSELHIKGRTGRGVLGSHTASSQWWDGHSSSVRLSEGGGGGDSHGERAGKGGEGRPWWMGERDPEEELSSLGEKQIMQRRNHQNTACLVDSEMGGPKEKAAISINTQLSDGGGEEGRNTGGLGKIQ